MKTMLEKRLEEALDEVSRQDDIQENTNSMEEKLEDLDFIMKDQEAKDQVDLDLHEEKLKQTEYDH